MARLFFRSDERLINLPVYPVNLPLKVMCDLIGASHRVSTNLLFRWINKRIHIRPESWNQNSCYLYTLTYGGLLVCSMIRYD